ncbi:MAG: HD domain-containing protein [Candidatus Njordarchaeum guaymaensis]
MADLKFVVAIRDPIHGIIPITRPEYELTVSPYFDRLRYIHKTGAGFLVYPAQNQTRYMHSIGVMHLAYKILKQVLDTHIKRVDKKTWDSLWSTEYKPQDIYQIIRFAGLLHDIGHGPFSHTTEPILEWILKNNFKENYKEYKAKNIGSVHEYYSYKMITEVDIIKEIIENAGINPYDIAVLLSKETEIPEKKQLLHKPGIRVLRKIIESQIDADRLDNLLRDSYGIGVPYGYVDVDSIIKNMFIFPSDLEGEENLDLVHHIRSLGQIEDMLDARYKMYRWLYYHQKVNLYDIIIGRLTLKLLRDKIISPEDFHYVNYAREPGVYVDDNWLLNRIRDGYNLDPDGYYLLKGIYQQDYLPISLWRNYEEFVGIVKEATKAKNPFNMAQKVYNTLKYNPEEHFKQIRKMISSRIKNGNTSLLFSLRRPTTPYDWRDDEQILVYVGAKKVIPIFEISLYIQKLVEMGESYITFYTYFYIKNRKRGSFMHLFRPIRRIFVEYIRKLYSEEKISGT